MAAGYNLGLVNLRCWIHMTMAARYIPGFFNLCLQNWTGCCLKEAKHKKGGDLKCKVRMQLQRWMQLSILCIRAPTVCLQLSKTKNLLNQRCWISSNLLYLLPLLTSRLFLTVTLCATSYYDRGPPPSFLSLIPKLVNPPVLPKAKNERERSCLDKYFFFRNSLFSNLSTPLSLHETSKNWGWLMELVFKDKQFWERVEDWFWKNDLEWFRGGGAWGRKVGQCGGGSN